MKLTRVLMVASATIMAALGIVATFAPAVLLRSLAAEGDVTMLLVVQALGAMYLGFAALNWMSRNAVIGGIYSRPLVIANLMHFMTAGLAMIKHVAGTSAPTLLWTLAIMYATFAIAFGVVMNRHPLPSGTDSAPT